MSRKRFLRTALVAASVASALMVGACASGSDDGSATTRSDPAQSNGESSTQGNDKYLEQAKKRGEPELKAVDAPAELEITDDVVGSGAEVKPGDTVTVEYKGAAASTGEVFDSSWSRGEPVTFPLDGVIEGWSKGLVGMKEGGRRTLVIPPELAYGNGGPAPGDALVFVVDLIGVE